MKQLPSSSLVIATYNWPSALELCLGSVLAQKILPGEVIIADDGSTTDTTQMVKSYQKNFPVPLHHVWHPDKGFRLAQIRNMANAKASNDYIIQIDADLVLHPHFVKDHVDAAKPGCFVGGSRVILNKELTEKLLKTKVVSNLLWKKGIRNKFNGLHSSIGGKILSELVFTNKIFNMRGCNMSYWKKDFVAINGYNEKYTGWGREDTDIIMRFYYAGLKRTFFKLRGVVYHLWHPEAERTKVSFNHSILEQTIEKKMIRSPQGVDQYL